MADPPEALGAGVGIKASVTGSSKRQIDHSSHNENHPPVHEAPIDKTEWALGKPSHAVLLTAGNVIVDVCIIHGSSLGGAMVDGIQVLYVSGRSIYEDIPKAGALDLTSTVLSFW